MKLNCPKCQAQIAAEDVNVATDLAKCVRCDEVFKASERMAVSDLTENLEPPAGSRINFEEDEILHVEGECAFLVEDVDWNKIAAGDVAQAE